MFLVAGVTMAAWAPLVPFAKERVSLEDGSFGLLLLCLGIGSIAAMPLTGLLVSRFGCRVVLSASTLVIALTLPPLAIASDVSTLALALALFGVGIGSLDVAINIQAVMVEQGSGRPMMSGFHGLFSVGGIVGAGGVSLLLRFGLTPLAATAVVSVVIVGLLMLARTGLLTKGSRVDLEAPAFAMPKGAVVAIGSLCFVAFLAEGAVLDWGALLLIDAHQLDPATAGFGYAAFALAMSVGRLAGDRVVYAIGGRRVLVLGAMISASGFALSIFGPSPQLALAGFGLVGLGASNIVPVLFTAAGAQTHMPAHLAIASVTTMGYAGILLGPAAIGLLAHAANLKLAMLPIVVGLMMVALAGRRALQR